MGSSSKKSSSGSSAAATPALPDATATGLPDGVTQQYYTDLSKVPTTGGLVRPVAGGAGQPMQGAGLNFYTPPAPIASRTALANTMNSGTTTPMGGQTQGGLYNNNAGARSYRGGRNSR